MIPRTKAIRNQSVQSSHLSLHGLPFRLTPIVALHEVAQVSYEPHVEGFSIRQDPLYLTFKHRGMAQIISEVHLSIRQHNYRYHSTHRLVLFLLSESDPSPLRSLGRPTCRVINERELRVPNSAKTQSRPRPSIGHLVFRILPAPRNVSILLTVCGLGCVPVPPVYAPADFVGAIGKPVMEKQVVKYYTNPSSKNSSLVLSIFTRCSFWP